MLLGPLKLAFGVVLALVALIFLAWIVDWILVFKVWPEGINYLKGILASDLARTIDLAVRQGWAPGAVTGMANFVYNVVFRATGIHDMGMRFAEGAALSIPDTIVRKTYLANRDAIELAMVGTQLLGVRLATFALTVPLVLLAYLVAAADGLAQRAVRCASGGRESASLYRRAKHLQVVLLATAAAVGLALPVSVDWQWISLPGAILLAMLAKVQWTYYKKHL